MNRINVKRMLLAGLAMLVMWVAVEVLVEGVAADLIFGQSSSDMWLQVIDESEWSGTNTAVNAVRSVLNCTILIWLYASLRPMYGVGTKTVLITSAFALVWIYSMFVSIANMGLIPSQLALLEAVFETIEFPIAMYVGASIYEGKDDKEHGTE
jgi:hypothetical protein